MNIGRADSSGERHLALSGEYSFADAPALRQALLGELDQSPAEVRLDLAAMESCDLTFFQILFSLASQAALEGKRVVLEEPLPEPLRRVAGELGFSQNDLEQAFALGGAR